MLTYAGAATSAYVSIREHELHLPLQRRLDRVNRIKLVLRLFELHLHTSAYVKLVLRLFELHLRGLSICTFVPVKPVN
jgi:hypothetical protein